MEARTLGCPGPLSPLGNNPLLDQWCTFERQAREGAQKHIKRRMALKVSAPLGAACVPWPHPRAAGRRAGGMRAAPEAPRVAQPPMPHRCTCAAAVADAEILESTYKWQGIDQFSELNDRRDVEPLPLPLVTAPLRVVLVRHGQSTWNASGRIQGSSDFAVLTPKGEAQADTTRQMVRTRVDKHVWQLCL